MHLNGETLYLALIKKEVGIELFVIDQCGRGLDHPDIAIASITKGQLDFLTLADNEEHFRDFVLKKKKNLSKKPYKFSNPKENALR
jgi:hypothetical protein